MPTIFSYYEEVDRIIRAACKVGGFSYAEFVSRKKSLKMNVVRGVACVISRYRCIHPSITAKLIGRTRGNVINVARKYHHYLQARDKITLQFYNNITKMIDDNEQRD